LIITLVNSIGAYKVKRQTSNISKPFIPDALSLFSASYLYFKKQTYIFHKYAVLFCKYSVKLL